MHTIAVTQADEPTAAHLASLVGALETECKLLEELGRVLARQRDGVAGNDIELLDESVYAAQRVFLTLQQARRQRSILLQLLVGEPDASVSELGALLGRLASPEILTARDRLLSSARSLAHEVDLNRRILDGAMEVGDQLIRALSGASTAPPVYSADATEDASGASGAAFVNTRV